MVACHEEQRYECDLFAFHGLDLSQGRLSCGIALNSSHMVIGMTIGSQHIVELAIECRSRALRSMAYEEHVLTFLGIGRMTVHQHLADLFRIFYGIKQWCAYPDTVEERSYLLHILTQTVHLDTVDDVRWLDLHRSDTFATQFQQGVNGCVFLDSPLGQTLQHDTGGVGLADLQLRKGLRCLLVNRIDGLLTGIVVGRAEMDHQQRSVLRPTRSRAQEHQQTYIIIHVFHHTLVTA